MGFLPLRDVSILSRKEGTSFLCSLRSLRSLRSPQRQLRRLLQLARSCEPKAAALKCRHRSAATLRRLLLSPALIASFCELHGSAFLARPLWGQARTRCYTQAPDQAAHSAALISIGMLGDLRLFGRRSLMRTAPSICFIRLGAGAPRPVAPMPAAHTKAPKFLQAQGKRPLAGAGLQNRRVQRYAPILCLWSEPSPAGIPLPCSFRCRRAPGGVWWRWLRVGAFLRASGAARRWRRAMVSEAPREASKGQAPWKSPEI